MKCTRHSSTGGTSSAQATTCFFSMIHEATYSDDEDEEWEEEQEYDEAKLKVEVHKTNDRWLR